MIRFFLFLACFWSVAWAQEERETTSKANVKTVYRKSVSLDYNSWFESLKVQSGGSTYQTKALLYGAGLSYEYSIYKSDWGWGFLVGIMQGYGIAGSSSDTSSYYAKRVSLNLIRFGGRVFTRVGPRLDIGVAGIVNYRSTPWPIANGWEVKTGTNPLIGAFLDTRWRVNLRWDILQSLGAYNQDSSLAWRVGASYTF